MRWKIQSASCPSIGTKRKVLKFAVLPTIVGAEYVWWEKYWSVEQFTFDGWEEITKWTKDD